MFVLYPSSGSSTLGFFNNCHLQTLFCRATCVGFISHSLRRRGYLKSEILGNNHHKSFNLHAVFKSGYLCKAIQIRAAYFKPHKNISKVVVEENGNLNLNFDKEVSHKNSSHLTGVWHKNDIRRTHLWQIHLFIIMFCYCHSFKPWRRCRVKTRQDNGAVWREN